MDKVLLQNIELRKNKSSFKSNIKADIAKSESTLELQFLLTSSISHIHINTHIHDTSNVVNRIFCQKSDVFCI